MAKKLENRISPIGEAKWAHVHTPKPPFEGTGEGKFQIDVVFERGGEWDALGNEITKIIKAEGLKNSPIKHEKDKGDKPTGRFFITFKTGEQFPPKVFDKHGQTIPSDVLVGNGSQVRVSYKLNQYPGFGGGLNCYLNAVQVVDLVEYSGGSAADFGFPVEEDNNNPFLDYEPTGDNEFPVDDDDPGPTEKVEDDEIPF